MKSSTEVIHVIGIALVFGSIMIVDLRLMGLFARNRPFTRTAQELLRWTWSGFVVALCSGSLMFVSNAQTYWYNGFFRFKMFCLLLAGINMLIMEVFTIRSVASWDANTDATPIAARTAGFLSICLWITITIFGRWIGFTLTPAGFS